MMRCRHTLKLDYDSVFCNRPDGHDGPHLDVGEGGPFSWREVHPDDYSCLTNPENRSQ